MELLSRSVMSDGGGEGEPPTPPSSSPPPLLLHPQRGCVCVCVRVCLLQEWSLFLITGRDLVIKTRASSPSARRRLAKCAFSANGARIRRKTNEEMSLSSVTDAH